MYSKAKIFNLALGALLLTKKISDTQTDTSTENQVLNIHWDTAFQTALEEMDLDGTSSQKSLELIEEDPTDLWQFAYKYPSNCSFLRRIQNSCLKDTESNQIQRRVAIHNDKKVIFTNQEVAVVEYIPNDFNLAWLSASAGLCIAYKLAILSAPLITGKGANDLRKTVQAMYGLARSNAQEHDRLENANFETDNEKSGFVEARTS